jgi:DNA-binding IclR family transcriptional regulator
MAVKDDENGAGTVARVIRVLATLADHGGEISVNQLAERVQLAPSTVHRLLGLLREEDIVESNPETRGYLVGPNFYRIASRVVESTPLPRLVRPYIEELAQRFNETVLFATYLKSKDAMSFAARADGHQALQYRIQMDEPLSLLWGSSGKVILAQLPSETVERVLKASGPSPATGTEPPTLAKLNEQLAAIRAAGWATSDSEKLPGARGIAAPVFSGRGVVGCLILTSPRERLPHGSIDEISRAIILATQELSRSLGATEAKSVG